MNSFIKLCPKCGRGYIPDMDHRCDPLDTDIGGWFARLASIWFVLFVAAAVVLILWILL